MRTPTRQLRRHPNLVDVLPTQPVGIAGLVNALNAGRRRRVDLVPIDAPPGGPCGLVVSTERTDYIFYATNTTPFHQLHIQCHELAHLLLGHTDASDEARFNPSLDASLAEQLLGHGGYTSQQERDAELVGSLMVRHIVANDGPPQDEHTEPRALATLSEVFEHRRTQQ